MATSRASWPSLSSWTTNGSPARGNRTVASWRSCSCIAANRKLQRYCKLRQEAGDGDVGNLGTEFVLKLLKKRLFSSPAAFLHTLTEHEKTLRGVNEKKVRRSVATLKREL